MRGTKSSLEDPCLSAPHAVDVLRYWLASIRLEEALAARPRAQRSRHEERAPRLDQPQGGQEYFKQPLDDALTRLLFEHGTIERSLDGELSAFFEDWLLTRYRRGQDDSEQGHLLCFPVLQLPREELAGLLRAPLTLQFVAASGHVFRVPSRRERARGAYPEAPSSVRLTPPPRREGTLPLFVDTRLLHNTLGVRTESIDALFETLRGLERVTEAHMLTLVAELLEREASPESPSASQPLSPPGPAPEGILARITRAAQELLRVHGARAEAYAVAIVLDGTQSKTTFHLQRELTALIEDGEGLARDSALGSYLRGHGLTQARAVSRAQFLGASMTDSQRDAAEHSFDSTLTSVQGPPGTGKTTLILHLCAEHLVRSVDALVDKGAPAEDLLVVTSSNNRAVDNVLDPLLLGVGAEGGAPLPLGLRAGSKQVVEHVLAGTLRRVSAWLSRAEQEPRETRGERLSRAIETFREVRATLDAALLPRAEAFRLERERATLERELLALQSAPAALLDEEIARLPEAAAKALSTACLSLETRLSTLARICEDAAGPSPLRTIAKQYGRMLKREIPAFEAALKEAGRVCAVPLPPQLSPALTAEDVLDAWQEATEQSLANVSELRNQLKARSAAISTREAVVRLEARHRALPPVATQVDAPSLGALPRALFEAGVAVREAWAKDRAEALRPAVEVALRAAEGERSLRPMFRDEPDHAALLRQLFPIWGSTLLSLGNCFPPESQSIARVIIDEAGQCHPAHAVSALCRARTALVLGDVHQLTPVFELGLDDDERVIQAARLAIPKDKLAPYRVHTQAHSSAQALAEAAVFQKRTLTNHFRCQPEIIALSDALCGYGLTVHTKRESRVHEASFLSAPVCFVDTQGVQEGLLGSYCNRAELSLALALVEAILASGIAPSELAVITPYRGQLSLLRGAFRERGLPLERSTELSDSEPPSPSRAELGLALGTVHRFQGGERSIVILSSVVTERRSLPFLDARPNLLNVAISRARHHFVCIGHRATLSQGARTRVVTGAAHPLSPRTFLDRP